MNRDDAGLLAMSKRVGVTLASQSLFGVLTAIVSIDAIAIEVGLPVLVSTTETGEPAAYCDAPRLSTSARYVSFMCSDTMVADDHNGTVDTFTKDLHTGRLVRVSLDNAGNDTMYGGHEGIPSDDGFTTVFASDGPLHPDVEPVPGERRPNVFLRDIERGTTDLVSRMVDGNAGPVGFLAFPLDAVFHRHEILFLGAGNYGTGPDAPPGYSEIYLRNWVSGAVERISARPDGGRSDGDPRRAAMSDDGRYVAFSSNSTDITSDNPLGYFQVFLRDRVARTTVRITRPWHGGEFAHDTLFDDIGISKNGRLITFVSWSNSELTPDENRFIYNAFLYDRVTGSMEMLNPRLANPTSSDDSAVSADISEDGRIVALFMRRRRPIDDAPTGPPSILVRDRATGQTIDASATLQPEAFGHGHFPHIDLAPDGRKLVFTWWGGDGEALAGFSDTARIYSVDIRGGPLPRVAEIPTLSRSMVAFAATLVALVAMLRLRRRRELRIVRRS